MENRFWIKVDKNGPVVEKNLGPCWLWTASLDGRGYGQFNVKGRTKRSHRIAYELVVGKIPRKLVLDHLCRTKRCVNPRHLEAVTHRENLLRGVFPDGRLRRDTHCKHGHKYTEANTWTYSGGKKCRECNRLNAQKVRDRKKAQGATSV